MMGLLRSSFAVVLLLSLLEQSSSFVPLRRPSSFSSSSSTTAKLFAEDLNTDAVVSRRKTLDAAALGPPMVNVQQLMELTMASATPNRRRAGSPTA